MLAFDHPVVRVRMSGRELRELIEDDAYISGPEELEPGAQYSVAASELIAGAGQRRRHGAAGARLVPCTLSDLSYGTGWVCCKRRRCRA